METQVSLTITQDPAVQPLVRDLMTGQWFKSTNGCTYIRDRKLDENEGPWCIGVVRIAGDQYVSTYVSYEAKAELVFTKVEIKAAA